VLSAEEEEEMASIAELYEQFAAGAISRRTFVRRLSALGLSVPAIAALTSAPSLAAQSDPTTLLIASPETPPGLDTEYHSTRGSHETIPQVMDALVQFGKKEVDGIWYSDFDNLGPALAETWEIAPDGKAVTFHLRQGVISHWGNELTAEDVHFSWDRGYQLQSNRAFYYFFLKMTDPSSVQVVDKYTVRFVYNEPSSIAAVMHTNLYLTIHDSVAVKANATTDDPWATAWVAQNGGGFGPYYVEKWAPGQEIVFRAHEGYWQGAPTIKQVIYREVPSSANRFALVQTGAVDAAGWLLPNELIQLQSSPDVTVNAWRSNFLVALSMSVTKPPFDNPKVREALKWAVPYQDALDSAFFGLAEPAKSLVPSVFPDYTDQYYAYTTDLEKAKSVLTEAGFPDGFQTELTYNAEVPWDEQLAIMIQTNLAEIGVDVTLNKLPGGPYADKMWGKELTAYFFEDQPNVPAAEYALWAFANSQSRGDHTSYSNAQVDELTNGALATLDPETRKQMNFQCQDIVCNDGPYAFIAFPPFSYAFRKNVTGARWYPAAHLRWDEIEKA
jgi:peptide/nickel transport system substrate-binding protein